MFILTIAGAEDEGAYSVVDAEGEKEHFICLKMKTMLRDLQVF